MQIYQLQHPADEIILCDDGCDLAANYLEVTEEREYRCCPLHTHASVHASRLPQRPVGMPSYRSRPRLD